MNWLQNSTLAIGLVFAFAGCKKGEELSSEIRPRQTDLSSNYKSDFELETHVVNFDSISTNNSSRLLLGKHTDPAFGTVTANAYLRFISEYSGNSFGPNPVADAAYLRFSVGIGNLSPYFYGSTSEKVKVLVYRNTNEVLNSLYYKEGAVTYNAADLLGTVELDRSSFNASVTSFINLELPKSIAQEFVENQSKFISVETFQNYFKGFALISDDANKSVIGIFDLSMVVLFHNYYGLNNLYSSESITIQTRLLPRYPLIAQNQFVVDRTTGDLGGLGERTYDAISTTAISNKCYIQPNTGVFTKVEFKSLDNFKDIVKQQFQSSKILINKAELVIKPITDDSYVYLFPLQLYALELNKDGTVKSTTGQEFQYLQNELSGIFGTQAPLYTSYNSAFNEYRFSLTTYVQAILDGNKENNGLLIGAANELSGRVALGSLNRLKFYNDPTYMYKDAKEASKIELRVFYTPYK